MKRIRLIGLIGLIIAALSGATVWAGYPSYTDFDTNFFAVVLPNLVSNGGFNDCTFNGWTQSGNPGSTGVQSGGHGPSGCYLQAGPGSLGFISQSVATTAGLSYRISLWVQLESGGVNNELLVKWGGTTVYDKVNFDVTTWTNVQLTVTATGPSAVLTVGYVNNPAYFDVDDISVTAVGAPAKVTLAGVLGEARHATNADVATVASGGWPTTWEGSAITSAVIESAHATNSDNATTAATAGTATNALGLTATAGLAKAGDLLVTNGAYVVANTWAGPSNVLDMAVAAQLYATVTPCSVTGLVNLAASQSRMAELWIWNAESTNVTVSWSPLMSSRDGQQSAVCTNGQLLVVRFTSYGHVAEAEARPLWNGTAPGTPGDTTASLTANNNPSVFGQAVTLTAKVNVGLALDLTTADPTGTVSFKDGGTSLGFRFLSGDQAVVTTSSLAVGTHTLSVTYNGDDNWNVSTSDDLIQTVNKADTSPVLSSSANPAGFGQSVTFTCTVNPVLPGAGTVSGTVTFKDGGATIGTGTLSSGQATFTTSGLGVGAHSITAEYGGNGSFNASSSTTALTETIVRDGSTMSLASSVNPSALGESVTFTATVSGIAPGSGTPTGTVTFKDGSATIGTGTLSSGMATYATSSLDAQTHSITGVYGGDGNFNGSTSPPLSQTVNP